MGWFAVFHATWGELAAAVMAASGLGMGWDLCRNRRNTARDRAAHPANREPFDWSRDRFYRQSSCVHRRAS